MVHKLLCLLFRIDKKYHLEKSLSLTPEVLYYRCGITIPDSRTKTTQEENDEAVCLLLKVRFKNKVVQHL